LATAAGYGCIMSAAKQKGTAWETAIVRALDAFFDKRHGLYPRRVAQTGMLDTGDVHGISPFVGQAKNYRNLTDGLREGLEGVELQKIRAGEPYGVAFVKRVRKSVGSSYAVMTLATWARVVLRLKRAEEFLSVAAPDAYARFVEETAKDEDRPV
jgi:hypothetical protein